MPRALAIILGVLLLLPGACSLGFIGIFLFGGIDPYASALLTPLVGLWLVSFLVSAGGVMLIRKALRGLPQPPQAN